MPSVAWKRVAYMDETHNADSYWICGVVVPIDHIVRTKAALTEVAEEAAKAYGLGVLCPELHGYELFQGEGEFSELFPRARVDVYSKALDALAAADPVIILRGVRRPNIRMMNPHRLAWRYAIESVDEFGGAGPILVVADEHAETESALRGDIRSYRSSGTGGWKPRTIVNVLPGLRFLDSRTSTLLQAADLVVFLHQRRFNIERERDARSQKARESLWAKVAPFVAVQRLWEPPY
jgi:Protein of unknown function (DUF3800)